MNRVDFFIKYNTLKNYGNVTQFFKHVFMSYGNGYKWKNGKIKHDPKRVIDHYISEEDMYNTKVEQYSQIYNILSNQVNSGIFDDNIKLKDHVLGIINNHENRLQRIHDFIYNPDIEFNVDDLKDGDIYHTQFSDSDLISNIPDNIHPTWKKHIRNFYDVIYKYIINKCPENVEYAKKLYGNNFFDKIENTIYNF